MKKFFTLILLAVMAIASQANELTVADGTETVKTVPVYGMYTDYNGTMGQMIYPADMLTDMVGGQITGLKFYSPEIKFNNVTLQLSLKTVDQNGYETAQAITDATVVASTIPAVGDQEMNFEFDTPFEYGGGNLMVEVLVTAKGNWATTEFYGVTTQDNNSMYIYYWSNWGDPTADVVAFLPKATFTYEAGQAPVDPTQACAKPEGGYVNGTDFHGVLVTLINNETAEGTEIHYNITLNDELIVEDAIYDDAFALTVDGDYYIDFWATAPGMLDSTHGGLIFTIDPTTGLSEMNADKAVAGVRYFNMAGQEMQQPQGLTIVLTTYTDGTTSTAKVIK